MTSVTSPTLTNTHSRYIGGSPCTPKRVCKLCSSASTTAIQPSNDVQDNRPWFADDRDIFNTRSGVPYYPKTAFSKGASISSNAMLHTPDKGRFHLDQPYTILQTDGAFQTTVFTVECINADSWDPELTEMALVTHQKVFQLPRLASYFEEKSKFSTKIPIENDDVKNIVVSYLTVYDMIHDSTLMEEITTLANIFISSAIPRRAPSSHVLLTTKQTDVEQQELEYLEKLKKGTP